MKTKFDHPDFPSGEWIGFYQQAGRHRQEMALLFCEGFLRGSGEDDLGRFLVSGEYDVKTKKVRWIKTYAGSHAVLYRGYREFKGIWGVWEIAPGLHGGFHIWPKAEGEGLSETTAAEEPAAEPQTVPAPMPKRKG
ncbi:MAG: hypothetical protein HY717_24070 [Planctomycetes bacterium]|nr:hypothetical protein [Planctomycetota bacterium]